jgi:hypothetical protein
MKVTNPAIISILLFFLAAHLNAALPPIDLTLKNGECPTIQLKIVPKNMGSSKTKKGHSYFELEVSSRHVGRVNGKIKEVRLVDINNQGTNFEFKKKSKTLSSSTLIIANNSIKGTTLIITYHSNSQAIGSFFSSLIGLGGPGPTAYTTYIIPLDTLSGMAPKPRKNQAVGGDEESQKGE